MLHEFDLANAITLQADSAGLKLIHDALAVIGCQDSSMEERLEVATKIHDLLDEKLGVDFVDFTSAGRSDFDALIGRRADYLLLTRLHEADVMLRDPEATGQQRGDLVLQLQDHLEAVIGDIHWFCAGSEDYDSDCEVCNAFVGDFAPNTATEPAESSGQMSFEGLAAAQMPGQV